VGGVVNFYYGIFNMTLEERNQKVRAFFNGKIDTYDDVHSEYMKTKVLLAESLGKDAKKILDLGGGTGLELIHLFELFPQAEVTVIDITENMLEKLKTRDFAGQVTAICGDFFDIPLTSENEIDALEKAGFTQITTSNGGKENYGLFIARKG